MAVLAVLLSACSTLNFAAKEETVLEVVNLINYGTPEELQSLSDLPFVLDGEIVFSGGTITDFWTGLRASGFLLRDAVPVVIQEVAPGTSSRFSTSREMEIFFEKHLVEKAVCVDLETADGVFHLLLGEKRGDYPVILGFGGPVK